ncbi:MAG: M20/M25/M40 family metallo-hydrolase [Clostridia bacterium]|nr:M20/M25/M40 family metallo-hydrolase [Clostridia bacterium]
MLNIFEIQKKLVASACPSGSEKAIASTIAEIALPYADEIFTDALGNLFVHKKGEGKKVICCAHMDCIGFMVTDIDDKGFIHFETIGGFNPQNLIHRPIKFLNGQKGLITSEYKEDGSAPKKTDLYIDIGARGREEAEKLVAIGDTAVYEGSPVMLNDDLIMGPYLDDLIGCTALLYALTLLKDNKNDIYLAFTTQEEVGCRGAKTASYTVNADFGFCIDVTMVGDYPATTKPPIALALGKGAAIKIKDSSLICSKDIVEMMKKCAESNGIKYQLEVLRYGGTDASAIQLAHGGALAGGISIPTRYIHTPVETCSVFDVIETAKLTAACLDAEPVPSV